MILPANTKLLRPGDIAPDYTLEASSGASFHLADVLLRTPVVMVFYPGDNTPGCTAQLCELRDNFERLSPVAVVVGINPADKSTHEGFAARKAFPFPLLADVGSSVAAAYGCAGWFGIPKRTVYIVARDGNVLFVQPGRPSVDRLLQALHSSK